MSEPRALKLGCVALIALILAHYSTKYIPEDVQAWMIVGCFAALLALWLRHPPHTGGAHE